MIFITTGTQLPFDRLIKAVDLWAGLRRRKDLFAQIGSGGYRPRNIRWQEFVDAPQFEKYVRASDAIVSHAGMGTIITALYIGKPILIMPRQADLREHRNDHQVATARHLAERFKILVAYDEIELMAKLDELIEFRPTSIYYKPAVSPELIDVIKTFIEKGNEAI